MAGLGSNFGVLRTNADGNLERVYFTDEEGNPIYVIGTTVPTSGTYAKGCIFIDSDVAAGSKAVYENQGSTSAVSFNIIGGVAATEITLASANILVGSADGTARAQPLSGDGTITSAGALTITNNAITNAKMGDDAIKQAELDYETADVTVAAGAVSGTAEVTASSIIVGFYPSNGIGGAAITIGSMAVAGTAVTVYHSVTANAAATYRLTLLKV